LYYAKAAFGCGFVWQPTPLVGLLTFGKSKSRYKPNQRHPKGQSNLRATIGSAPYSRSD
jgi:hypothetical protein